MDENPYKSPLPTSADLNSSPKQRGSVFSRLLWSGIGFVLGTVLLAPLILSMNPIIKIAGGAMYGGPLGAVAGYLYGRRQRGKKLEIAPSHESSRLTKIHPQPPSEDQ